MKKRCAVLTSCSRRHLYFLEQIKKNYDVKLVIIEKKPEMAENYLKYEKQIFDEFDSYEKDIVVEMREINHPKIAELISSKKIDVGFVFGTSILKDYIINSFREIVVNIHTGLTQHYRGVDSTFWAFYNKDLDKIGVTIHKIDTGIDTGDVILQDTVEIETKDTPELIFAKLCKRGVDLICENTEIFESEKIYMKKLENLGKIYKSKDKKKENIEKVSSTYSKLIKEFLEK